MTKDHLFPKSLVSPGQRRVTRILQNVDPNFRGRQGTFLAQNGVTKSTLCSDCNNRVLGTELDPALIDAYKAASKPLKLAKFPVMGTLYLYGVHLNKVARAVAGHMIALSDKPEPRSAVIRHLRRFVLGQCGLHSSLRFHMWLYPSSRQGMLKDLFHTEFGSGYEPMWISAFKTYPLAFAFSTEVENPNFRLHGVMDLTPYVSNNTMAYNLKIPTRPIVDFNWPYAPHRNGAILTGNSGSLTTQPFKIEAAQREATLITGGHG
ncbi:hypothetical protein [Pseudomonas syringae group genomosp. 3]|uniref:hypothetical protein n=1 Tax=Pseudomonas syringae group genomosp. 3 TaxID=251701 RepID=UPI000AFBF21F|nr:hypothetical protein [Pseudomonas syringae group genomosp. 3]MBM0212498.1 hypothetical protein [Pseudomonas syringae pv. maculicola]